MLSTPLTNVGRTDFSETLIVTKIPFNGIQGFLTHGYELYRSASLDHLSYPHLLYSEQLLIVDVCVLPAADLRMRVQRL